MKVKNVMAYKSYVCFVLYSWLQIYTNTNSFIDNQFALTSSINQHNQSSAMGVISGNTVHAIRASHDYLI